MYINTIKIINLLTIYLKLSSRSLREQIKPVFIMKLDTEYNGSKFNIYIYV